MKLALVEPVQLAAEPHLEKPHTVELIVLGDGYDRTLLTSEARDRFSAFINSHQAGRSSMVKIKVLF